MHCGKISKAGLNPCVKYDKQHTRFGTLYIHSYRFIYVFLLCFGGYLLFFISFVNFVSYFFTGVVDGFLGVI